MNHQNICSNPIIKGQGVCDPHIHIFQNRAYLYASHDESPQNTGYSMKDWVIYSSDDLVHWEQESTFYPEDTYIGSTQSCWAVDAAEKDGRYYYYFSHGTQSTGVAVSDQPGKGFKDALGKPLLDLSCSKTRPYDPAVFTDDDGLSYIIFGTPVWANGDSYYIARLNEDMISLAEKPRKIIVDDQADDKPFLHKHNGIYYLSWASHYAVSDNVYGPYHYVGNTGAANDHGNFFEWKGQWFQSFTIYDPTPYHRATGLCYIHYRANGEMVADQRIIESGVGQYDAEWNKIYSVWYMEAQNVQKKEYMNCSFILCPDENGFVKFPNIHNIKQGQSIYFFASCTNPQGAVIEVRENSEQGELLGSCVIENTGFDWWRGYRIFKCPLRYTKEKMDLCFVFKGSGKQLCNIEWFRFAE